MARSAYIALLAVAGLGVATPALAQFDQIFRGNPLEAIFGSPPPRPPSDVPNRQPYPGERRDPNSYPPQQGGLQPPGPPPSRIRGEPLPPPGGYDRNANLPPPTPGAPPPGLRPQQPQRGANQPPAAPAAPAAPPPPSETIVEPTANKIPNPTAVFSGLDKITGRIISFDVAINETVRFGALEVTPRACYTRPPTEAASTDGFIEVDELTLQGELKRIFTGWMFAASPGLNAVEHPIYDVWLADCKGGAQPAIADAGPTPGPVPDQPARAPQQQQPRPQQRTQQQPQQPPLPGQPPQPTPQRRPPQQQTQQQLPPPPGFQRQ
jgi:hypothetical protein